MRAIWKYPMKDIFEIFEMPEGAKILTVQMQGRVPVIWAEVNKVEPLEKRAFRMIATGEEWNGRYFAKAYVGTVQLEQVNGLVFHCYETYTP